MKSVEELAKEYYEAILKYEEHFKESKEQFLNFFKENTKGWSKKEQEMSLEIYKTINQMYEKEYAPWRLIEGDITENLIKIFSSKKGEIINYLRVGDGLEDTLIERAEAELTEFYSKQGLDTDKEEVYDKIVDESINLDLQEEIDSNIFSNDVIELHSLTRCFNKVCKDLTDYFVKQTSEKEVDNDIEEIEKE